MRVEAVLVFIVQVAQEQAVQVEEDRVLPTVAVEEGAVFFGIVPQTTPPVTQPLN